MIRIDLQDVFELLHGFDGSRFWILKSSLKWQEEERRRRRSGGVCEERRRDGGEEQQLMYEEKVKW